MDAPVSAMGRGAAQCDSCICKQFWGNPATASAMNRSNMNSTATAAATLIPVGTWSVDPAHSTVGFSVKHLGIATVRGQFEQFEGDLTMNGVTNRVTLTADVQGTETDPWGNERVGIEVIGQLKRGDWNMTFNQALGSGNLLVGEKVTLSLDISAVKQS